MTDAKLLDVLLAASFVSCDHREALPEHLTMGLDVDEAEFEVLGDGRIGARLSIAFSLFDAADANLQVDVEGTFRAIYLHATFDHEDEGERRAFVARVGLRDIWPVWLTWVRSTLATMGLAPAPLPWEPPAELVDEALASCATPRP